MNKDEIKDLIADMPFGEADKATLMADLNNNMPVEAIIKKIESLLTAHMKMLNEKDPEGAAEYAKIDEEYKKDVDKAYAEFDEKMNQLEKEAADVDKEVSSQLDQVRAEEIKQDIKG